MSETPAVTLRPRADDDVELLYRLAAELQTWEERSDSAPGGLFTKEAYRARLARAADSDTAADTAAFVIEADGDGVGSAVLFGADHLAHHAEAGITLLPEARGRGIGTAALALLVEFGFERRNLRRVHLRALASNAAALAAYTKVGFVEEGRLREHAWARGRYQDMVLMGILRSQWVSTR